MGMTMHTLFDWAHLLFDWEHFMSSPPLVPRISAKRIDCECRLVKMGSCIVTFRHIL